MYRFFIELTEYVTNESDGLADIHYNINNLDEFVTFVKNLPVERDKNRQPIAKIILVNNLKIISQQIINALNIKDVAIQKQVDDDIYSNGRGVKNIYAIKEKKKHPKWKIVDLNILVGKQTEIIKDSEEFKAMAALAEKLIAQNNGKLYKSVASIIRNDLENIYKSDKEFRNIQWKCRVNGEELKYYKHWFHGGLNCVNENKANKLYKNVYHGDMISAYISQMCFRKYPVSKPYKLELSSVDLETKRYIIEKGYYLGIFSFKNIETKYDGIDILGIFKSTCPYRDENGFYYFTNYDYKIFTECYTVAERRIIELNIFRLEFKKLPESVTNLMMSYYEDKKNATNDVDRKVAKLKVNCNYGVFGSGIDVEYCNIFWALYTTSYQRYELFNRIKENGFDNFIYCNTDSIFSACPLFVKEKCKGFEDLGLWKTDKCKKFAIRKNNSYIALYDNNEFKPCIGGVTKASIYSMMEDKGWSIYDLFNNFFNLVIEAKYGGNYVYRCNDKEVYKRAYDVGRNTACLREFVIIEENDKLLELIASML